MKPEREPGNKPVLPFYVSSGAAKGI
jgi:hypothetical protein